MCLQCRGAKLLCGKPRCPIIVKAQSIARVSETAYTDQIAGSSPPGVFVGRYGYPRVSIGPMVPPQYGDTTILDTPEEWLGRPIETIVDYRYSLVRGNMRARVEDAAEPDLDDAEAPGALHGGAAGGHRARSSRRHRGRCSTLSEDTQPFGPSAPLGEVCRPRTSRSTRRSRRRTTTGTCWPATRSSRSTTTGSWSRGCSGR